MEETQKYIQLLKKQLVSGRKSEYQLDEFLKKKSIRQEFREVVISNLAEDKSVKVTRGGWFWRTRYFELKSKKASVEIENLTSWVGMCPPPPPNDKLKIMMSDNIWLPHPRQYLDLRELDSLRDLMLSVNGKQNYKTLMSKKANFTKEEFCKEWTNWKSFGQISENSADFRKEFRKVALGFDYSKYLNKTYYNEVPKFGYSVEESLHDDEPPESCGE